MFFVSSVWPKANTDRDVLRETETLRDNRRNTGTEFTRSM